MGTLKVSVLEKDGVEYESATEYDLTEAIKYVSASPKKITANLTNNSSATWVAPSDLALNLIAGKSYRLEYTIAFASAVLATGIAFQFTGTATATTFAGKSAAMTGSSTYSSLAISALNTAYVHTQGVPVANTVTIAKIDLIFDCLASGTFNINFRSETSGNTITIRAGSMLEFSEV
jgi:hypothetical protein